MGSFQGGWNIIYINLNVYHEGLLLLPGWLFFTWLLCKLSSQIFLEEIFALTGFLESLAPLIHKIMSSSEVKILHKCPFCDYFQGTEL